MPEQLGQLELTRTAVTWEVQLQIERAVKEFETAWRKGNSTEIEQALNRHSSVPPRELFCALLETELELRQRHGEIPNLQKWIERFPQWAQEVELAFAQSQSTEPHRTEFCPLPKPGDEFGRYRILQEVGRGAMGAVFQAEVIGGVAEKLTFDSDAATDASRGTTSRTVAIKVLRLPKSLSESERVAAIRLFRTEAAATSGLHHPHVISVWDVGDVNGVPYFSMPLISGGTLKQLRRQAPIEPVRAARLIEAAARALHHSHLAGRFHRDVKPSNLLLGPEDHLFVSDFGISMHREELGRGPGIAGTPLYMSPEQAAGKSDLIDGRSDVFSLAIVLYELLTGTHPYDTPLASPAEIIERICHVAAPPLRQRHADVPRSLDDICLKGLRRQPEDRYSTAADFADALAEFIASVHRPPPVVRTNRAVVLASVTLVLLIIGVMAGLKWQPQHQPQPQAPVAHPPTVGLKEPPSDVVEDPDRAAAEWLLSMTQARGEDRFRIWLRILNTWQDQSLVPGQPLPSEPFRLQHLRAWAAPKLTDQAFVRYLAPLQHLEILDVSHSHDLTYQTVASVVQLKQLKHLGLSQTQVTGKECVELFSKLPSLTHIAIDSRQFTDDLAEFVRTNPNLSYVSVHSAREDQVRKLFTAKQLTQVVIYGSTFADSNVWQEVLNDLPDLNLLGLTSSYLSDANLEAISRLPKLRELWLQDSTVTDSGLLFLLNCQTLRKLDVSRTRVTEACVRCLHAHLPQCQIVWDGDVIQPGELSESDKADFERLLDRVLVETNDDPRGTLLLALGEHDASRLTEAGWMKLKPLLVDWYEHSPSPALHSAIVWLARRWGNSAMSSSETSGKPSSLGDALRSRRLVLEQKLVPRDGGWYQPMHGPTMVVIPDRRTRGLSAAESSTTNLPRTFAISTAEVTEYEFHYVHETYWLNQPPRFRNRPRTNVTWQEGAWFCNRLSELEGIPPTRQCYEEFRDENGDKRLRAKPNALDLPGYRLPTAEEWAFVRRDKPADSLNKPNDLGLFDLPSDASIWFHDPDRSRLRETSTTELSAVIRVARTIPPEHVSPDRMVVVSVEPPVEPDSSQAVDESDAKFLPVGEHEIVSLGAWPRGRVKPRRLRVTNITDQPLTVAKSYLGDALEVRDPIPKTVEPSASVEFTVAVRDHVVGPRFGGLDLTFKTSQQQWIYKCTITGNVHGPVMNVFEGGISGRDRSAMGFDFLTVPHNAQAVHGFGVFCQGDQPLRIESIDVPEGFVLEPDWKPEIGVGKISGFRVRVDTSQPREYTGKVRLRSNDPIEPEFEFPIHARVSNSSRFSVIGVFRAGLWLFDHNRDGQADEEIPFGRAGDKPVTGDINGDGICDIGVCRLTSDKTLNWEFHLRGVTEQPPPKTYRFGSTRDVPFLSDPVGDGRFHPTIVCPDEDQRTLVWRFDTNGDGLEEAALAYVFGKAHATPVMGDWNGDGISDPGEMIVGDASVQFQNRWRLRFGPNQISSPILFGSIISMPISGDWDADGRSQIGILDELGRGSGRFEFRLDHQSGWHPRLEVPFGQHGDIPVVLSGNRAP